MKVGTTLSGWALLICSALLSPSVEAANILGLFSHPGKSHLDFFRPLFVGLAEAGHNVTIVSYFPNKSPVPNYTDQVLSGMHIFADNVNLEVFDAESAGIPFKVPTFFMLHQWGMQACEVAFNSSVIQHILATGDKYDVILLEQFNNDCMMAVAHLLKAPVVALSSCSLMPWHYKRMGSPFIPSFMPMNFLPHNDEMNFLQRLNNFIHFNVVNFLYNILTQRATNALIHQHFGPHVPPIEELVQATSIMLINQHFTLTGAFPYTPNVIEVGGLQIQQEKPLEPVLQTLLDNSSSGVIYISWGSMIRPETMPSKKRAAILSSIAQLPEYTFVMRWPNETLPDKPRNLHTRPWLPQRDILCHPNVKAFMAHGGLLGISEAAYCGVPLLVTPFYGDQFLNSRAVQRRKLGVIVEYNELSAESIVAALKTILKPSYSQTAKRLSAAYKSRPMRPLELAVWWVEHVIETKGAPLAQSSSLHSNWFVYNSFDVYLFLAALIWALISILRIAFKLCSSVFGSRKKVKLT